MISFDGGSFAFTSVVDGHVYSFCANASYCISFGSIAYNITRATGFLEGSFGMMVDIFESFPNATTFPIHVYAVLQRKQ